MYSSVVDSRSLSNTNIFLSGGLQISVKYKYIPQWRTPDLCQIIMYSLVVDSSSLPNTNIFLGGEILVLIVIELLFRQLQLSAKYNYS
jgi:hypothetical protein